MNDYEDIESARLDDIRDHMTFGWWLDPWYPPTVIMGISIVTVPLMIGLTFLFALEVPPLVRLFVVLGLFGALIGVIFYRCLANRLRKKMRKKIRNILDIFPIKEGMTLPDGTTIPAVPFHPKEMFFLGKICEFGPQTPEEYTFVNQWLSLRLKDWDYYTHIEARKKYQKYVIEYQQQMNDIKDLFTSSYIKTTSLENAFIFYSLAAKSSGSEFVWATQSESELKYEADAVIETFSRFYATIPIFPPALLKLSEFYKLGLGCKQDKEKSEKLFQQWLAIIKDGALAGNDEMKRYLFSYYVAHPQEHLTDIINFALKGEVEMKRYLFSYYVAHPQEHLNGIINFALKGEVEMIQLLVNYYSQIGDIDHCNYWASRLR